MRNLLRIGFTAFAASHACKESIVVAVAVACSAALLIICACLVHK